MKGTLLEIRPSVARVVNIELCCFSYALRPQADTNYRTVLRSTVVRTVESVEKEDPPCSEVRIHPPTIMVVASGKVEHLGGRVIYAHTLGVLNRSTTKERPSN